jgi:hypothetical protein
MATAIATIKATTAAKHSARTKPPRPDHHHLIADLLDLRDQVSGDQDRDAVPGERPDEPAHLDDARGPRPFVGSSRISN